MSYDDEIPDPSNPEVPAAEGLTDRELQEVVGGAPYPGSDPRYQPSGTAYQQSGGLPAAAVPYGYPYPNRSQRPSGSY